jgi:hypothetical protein
MHNNGAIKTPCNVLVFDSTNSKVIQLSCISKFQPLPTKHTNTHVHVILFIYKCTHVRARAHTLFTQPCVL